MNEPTCYEQTPILFWLFTVLFGGFVLFSTIPDIMVVPEAVDFVSTNP